MKKKLNINCADILDCQVDFSDKEMRKTLNFSKDGGKLVFKGVPWQVGEIDWKDAKYIVMDVVNKESWILGVTLEFWKVNNKSSRPNMTVIMGILPGIKTTLSFPIEALSSKIMFLPRTPGKLKTVIFGNRIDLDEIDRVAIGCVKGFQDQSFELYDLYLSSVEPEYPLPDVQLVDEFGQWKQKEWEGKIKSNEELIDYLRNELNTTQDSKYFDNWSEYGGWKEKQFGATGYFRTEHDGKRWWLVDPEGYAFISNGLDCINPGEHGRITDIEKFFQWLPPTDSEFSEAYGNRNGRSDEVFFSFAIANMIKAFGTEWHNSWAEITRSRMVRWGFNTVGNWSSLKFIRKAKMPYVWPLAGFPDTNKKIFRDFPDVFSAEYRTNAEKFAEQLNEFIDDKYMIGYFLRNEPNWAFIADMNIAEELLQNPEKLHSKDVLITFLSDRYNGNISKLNKAWSTNFSSFDDLRKGVKKASALSKDSNRDLYDFSGIMIEEYVKVPSQAAKRVDKNHMNLGMRYAFITGDNLLSGSDNFDVFSINCYKINPYCEVESVGRKINKPVMIGEFHFGSLDSGLIATGLRAVKDQKERGIAYRYYIENAASSSYYVGAHYFVLNDQSVLGRFDGENFQIGCVDVTNKPYDYFVQGVAEANKNIYSVAAEIIGSSVVAPIEIEKIGF